VETRRGQVIIIGAVALLVLGVIAALAIDIGHIVVTKATLQNASDAASVAAALELVKCINNGKSEAEARASAALEAQKFVNLNASDARFEIRFGKFANGRFTPQDLATTASAINVTAIRDSDAPQGKLKMFFASLAGVDNLRVSSNAVCNMTRGIRGLRRGADLRPFAIFEGDLAAVTPGSSMTIPFPQGGNDPVAPGNWGWLNLDGGALGTPELREWILNGYDGDIYLNDFVDGRPCTYITGSCGVRTALQSQLEQIIGEQIYLCVYDQVMGTGSNATFRIIGFAAFTLTSFKFQGNNASISGTYERLSHVPYGEVDPDAPPTNLCKIQLVQ
jgi:hypothetical protein